jgi:hypothetical protein
MLAPEGPELLALPPAERALLLDIAYDQLRYEFLAGQVSDADSRELSLALLLARSRVGAVPDEPPPVPPPAVRPDEGHEAALLALRGGWRDDEPFLDLRWRPAFHGLLDNTAGMPSTMEIGILDTRLRVYPESGRVRVEEFTLLEVSSLSPRSRVFRPVAFRGKLGLRSRRLPDRRNLRDVYVFGTEVGAGLSFDPLPGVLLYGVADLRLDLGSDLDHDVAFGPGGRVGAVADTPDESLRVHLFGDFARYAAGDTTTWLRGGAAARLALSRNTSLTVDSEVAHAYEQTWFEGGLTLGWHF